MNFELYSGFYEQKQQEQVFFTPNQSPVPPPQPSSQTPNYGYDALNPGPSVPMRPQSPSQHNQALASTSPGFSLHSIDEWQRRQDEDLNQIYCTIRRNHEVNRLKESGRLVSPQPGQRAQSSHQLYQNELPVNQTNRPMQQPTSSHGATSTFSSMQRDTLVAATRTQQPKYVFQERPEVIGVTHAYQPPQHNRSASLVPVGSNTSHTFDSTQNRSTLALAPIPPARPANLLHHSCADLMQQPTAVSPSEHAHASYGGLALYANPTKKRTLIEQTYYDRERFDQPEVIQPISLNGKWAEARLDEDWSNSNQLSSAGKGQSEVGSELRFGNVKPLPVQSRNNSYNTVGRSTGTNQLSSDAAIGLRSSASLGNLHSASCSSPPTDLGHRLHASKAHSVSLAADVNNVSFAHHDEEDDLDKLIKKIEQDAVIQDELGKSPLFIHFSRLFAFVRINFQVGPDPISLPVWLRCLAFIALSLSLFFISLFLRSFQFDEFKQFKSVG
jgi:hypothetical protein